MKITEYLFGKTQGGRDVKAYILENKNGTQVEILNYGGIIRRFEVDGTDIVTGYDTVEGYENGEAYMGAIIGRVANRIGKGKFQIDGQEYTVPVNNNGNANHGGLNGFDRKIWNGLASEKGLYLSYVSPDGEEGFPGNIESEVSYFLDDNDRLIVQLNAKTDKPTPVNLTMHPYFNLNGEGTINDHNMIVYSDMFNETDETQLPTGKIHSVEGTALDYTYSHKLGDALEKTEEEPIRIANGLDHNYLFKSKSNNKIIPMAELEGDKLKLTIQSDYPGLQVYTGNYLDDTGKQVYTKNSAVAMEPQNWPDAINKPHFPDMLLNPDELYSQTIIYQVTKKDETQE